MYGRLLEKSLGEDFVKSLGNMSKVDWLVTAGLLYSVLQIGHAIVPLWSQFRERNIPSPAELTLINSEYDSAMALYEEALHDLKTESYGSAIVKIDSALMELDKTASQRNMVQGLEVHKVLQARLRYLRAESLYYQGELRAAERELLKVVKLDRGHVSSRNLLAHLYTFHFNKPVIAGELLEASLSLNATQLFARFYQALASNDDKKIDEIAKEIIAIYQHQLAHENDAPATQRLAQLQASTPAVNIMIPVMLLQWLERKVESSENQKDILKMLSVFTATLQSQIFANQQQLQVMIKEARIKAYLKIASLRKVDANFNDLDLKDLEAFSLRTLSGDRWRHFFEYEAAHIDRHVTKLFTEGNRSAYLLDQEYRYPMRKIIIGWAKAGWMNADSNPLVQVLRDKLLLAKQDISGSDLQREIDELAASDELITHFLKQYVDGKGWEPWFRVVTDSDSGDVSALIGLACKRQNVNMHIYAKAKDDKSVIHEAEKFVSGEQGMHLLYDVEHNQLQILDEIKSPSRLYRWIALQSCWDLLKQDPANAVAINLAGDKGLAVLPEMARQFLASDNLPRSTATTMIAGLGLFAERHKGECQDGRVAAQEVKDKLQARLQATMFTKERVLSAVGAAALVGLGAYFIRNK